MATDASIRQISRSRLKEVFKDDDLVRLMESILYAIRTTSPGAIEQVQTNLDVHIADPTDAHAASAIENTPAGTIASADVQGAINELDNDTQAVATGLLNHIADTLGAHAASAISVTPAGGVLSTDVQSALEEVSTEAAAARTYSRTFMLMGA